MSKKDFWDDIRDEGNSKSINNPTLDDLVKYQRHHMKMLEAHIKEIDYINKLLSDCREEYKRFFIEDLPAIRKKLTEEHIDQAIQDEWITRLEKAMVRSFEESHKLASAFAVQDADAFRKSMEEKLKGL